MAVARLLPTRKQSAQCSIEIMILEIQVLPFGASSQLSEDVGLVLSILDYEILYLRNGGQ